MEELHKKLTVGCT